MGKRVYSRDPTEADSSTTEKSRKDFRIDTPNPLDSFGVFLACY